MFVPGLKEVLQKIFLAASLQNLSFVTLLGRFRIQMCCRQLLCFWLQEMLERKSLFLMLPSLQLSAAAKHDFLKETFCSSFAERTFKLWRRLDEPAIIRPTVAATPSFIQGKH